MTDATNNFDDIKSRNYYNGQFAEYVRGIGAHQDKVRAIQFLKKLNELIEEGKTTSVQRTERMCARGAGLQATAVWFRYSQAYMRLETYLKSGIDHEIPVVIELAREQASDVISIVIENPDKCVSVDEEGRETDMTDQIFKNASNNFSFHDAECRQIYAAIKTCRLVLNGRA
jgi:hypothetical protein